MKFYITKYALTDGIAVKHGEICHSVSPDMISIPGRFGENYHKPHWHTTPDAAVAQAERMRVAKIKSLEKSLDRLHKLTFKVEA